MKRLLCCLASISIACIGFGCSVKNFKPYDPNRSIQIEEAGSYYAGAFDESAAEIVSYDYKSKKAFVVNGDKKAIDVLDISNPLEVKKVDEISIKKYGAGINSVACKDGVVAAAVESKPKQEKGKIVFFKTDGTFISYVEAGYLPDMVTFTPDGQYAIAANEGEPSDDYKNDPQGSVSVISLKEGVENPKAVIANFNDFDNRKDELKKAGVRIFGPNASVSQDLEPEYITVSKDSKTAYICMQENNAIAVLDIENARIVNILPLGFKDHRRIDSKFDASDKDKLFNPQPWPVLGMYMPDSIASYEVNGKTYIVTANEGDSRDYDGYSEETRVGKLKLDKEAFAGYKNLQNKKMLGRLKTTKANGDIDGDGDYDKIYSYGARSFSIFEVCKGSLKQVYDSGSFIEEKTNEVFPKYFNCKDTNNKIDNRSDDKGPEPEALAIGEIGGNVYAFLGLERISGIMVFDISIPTEVKFLQYVNNRNFDLKPGASNGGKLGDIGPEGICFIPKEKSPVKKPLIIVANEVSGTTTLYYVNEIDNKK